MKLHSAEVEFIARLCHQANKAYCQAIGDHSQVDWEEAPEWQQASAVVGVQLHMNNPDSTPADSHKSWHAHKLLDGWRYGETKDPANKLHPCMVPFEELPQSQQAKDFIFHAIVKASI